MGNEPNTDEDIGKCFAIGAATVAIIITFIGIAFLWKLGRWAFF